jgi:energy-coupling factor transport system ATP-binding protein
MAIKFNQVSFEYAPKTVMSFLALKDINLDIVPGQVTAIVGATGSGKSTLVQQLNALLLPTSGTLVIDEWTITADSKPKNLKALRKHVGLVFQFPEYQLFEETILKDVCFGPINFGVAEVQAKQVGKECLSLVKIDESYYERSPLDISGGQKRRIAIAGILALEPDILVLDEPTAGLDPQGAKEMMELFMTINRQYGKTVIIVTHDMDHVLKYCDQVVVMNQGSIVSHTDKNTFFKDDVLLDQLEINPPAIISFQRALKAKGIILSKQHFAIDSLAKELQEVCR